MKYMLITPKCKVYIFRVYNLALTYQNAYGGTISVVSMQQITLQAGQVSRKSLTDSVEPV